MTWSTIGFAVYVIVWAALCLRASKHETDSDPLPPMRTRKD